MKTINFNKPQKNFWDNKEIDNNKVVAELWILKPTFYTTESKQTYLIGELYNYYDLVNTSKELIIIGTDLQRYNLFTHMMKEYGWQIKDSYDVDIKEHHLIKYKENNNKPVILNY